MRKFLNRMPNFMKIQGGQDFLVDLVWNGPYITKRKYSNIVVAIMKYFKSNNSTLVIHYVHCLKYMVMTQFYVIALLEESITNV